MTVDRGGRRQKRVPEEIKNSQQSQIEADLLQAIPEHVNRELVIKALVNVLDQVVQETFAVEKES